MVQILLPLFLFGLAFAQDEAEWLSRDHEMYSKQLAENKTKTNEARENLVFAKKRLVEFKGTASELESLEMSISNYESNIEFWDRGEKETEEKIKMNSIAREEQSLLAKNSNYLNCDANTPEINLEVTGAFKDIPRDNQDGLGTCYSNTAKNYLVALSNGKDIASFTDMALQYKKLDKDLSSAGIDGGSSCETLRAVKDSGYCPQQFSPLETGEKNPITEILFRRQKSLEDLTWNISTLKKFLNGVRNDTKPEYLNQAKTIIDEIKTNPNIILPLPVVRHKILEHSDPEFAKEVRIVRHGQKYKEAYKKFEVEMLKALLAGKSPAQIFDLYESLLRPSYERIGFTDRLPVLRDDFIRRANKDFKHKDFQKQLRASVDFIKKISGRSNESDETFAEYCVDEGKDLLAFVDSLQPILDGVKKDKINADVLLNADGSLKSPKDIIQLMVAPTCLNPENRQKIDFPISCDEYSFYRLKDTKDLVKETRVLRSKVVRSLIQGLPLGNTFPIGDGSHINTIVGLRFNPQKKQCEYLIRESQNGRSQWQAEKDIYKKISLLTEIRKR